MRRRYGDYESRVLVVLLGTAPAVFTETLMRLATAGLEDGDPFLPTEIMLLSTAIGARAAKEELLAANQQYGNRVISRYGRLLEILGPAAAGLPAPQIIVPKIGDIDVEDASSSDELDAIGDALLDVVRQITAMPNSILFLSLSGGRKGMSNLAGQVMSLFSRPQDRLIHVSVAPAWLERCPEFYFNDPSTIAYEVVDDDGVLHAVAPHDVQIELSHQPFLPMRRLLQAAAFSSELQQLTFRELVGRLTPVDAQASFALVIDEGAASAAIDGQVLLSRAGAPLPPRELAYLLLLAEAARRCEGVPVPMGDADACRYLELHETCSLKLSSRPLESPPDFVDRWKTCLTLFPGHNLRPKKTLDFPLRSFTLPAVSAGVFLSSEGESHRKAHSTARTSRQRTWASNLIASMAAAMPKDQPADAYRMPVGRPGPGNGVREHRLPAAFVCTIISSGYRSNYE